jgi:protein phosphatase
VVLVAGAVGTYIWALGHWFVGVEGTGNDEQVAVFRGLDVSIVGFDFYELHQGTGLAVGDLTPAARSRVRGGITADDSHDADRILDALRASRMPLCRTSRTAPSTPSADSSSTPAAPTPSSPTDPALAPTPVGTTATTTSAPATTSSSEPEENCRRAD